MLCLAHRTYSDALGRAVRTVEHFVDGVVSDGDDKTVSYTYNGVGVTSLSAWLTGGGVQTTEYVYGVTLGANGFASNDVVGATRWPDEGTGAADAGEEETVTLNALGQVVTSTDRNGTIHELTYDVLGRVIVDEVSYFGAGVDDLVVKITTEYDGQGNAHRITSYATGDVVVNQVVREFNGLGQLIAEWQEHEGAVDGSTSPPRATFCNMPQDSLHHPD